MLYATYCVFKGKQIMVKETANTYNCINAYLDEVRNKVRFSFL